MTSQYNDQFGIMILMMEHSSYFGNEEAKITITPKKGDPYEIKLFLKYKRAKDKLPYSLMISTQKTSNEYQIRKLRKEPMLKLLTAVFKHIHEVYEDDLL